MKGRFNIMSFQCTGLQKCHIVFFCIFFAMFIQILFKIHFRERYCFKSDLLPTIRHTKSSDPQFFNSFSHFQRFQNEDARVMSQTKRAPTAPLQQALAIDLYLSWPAVSHICTFILFSSILTIFVANSTPIVVFDSMMNSFFVNLEMMLDFPTPESPTNTTLQWKSESSFFFPDIKLLQSHQFFKRLIYQQAHQFIQIIQLQIHGKTINQFRNLLHKLLWVASSKKTQSILNRLKFLCLRTPKYSAGIY